MTSVSLFARATVFPASSAAQVPRRPSAADDGRQHDIDFRQPHNLVPSPIVQSATSFPAARPTSRSGRPPPRPWRRQIAATTAAPAGNSSLRCRCPERATICSWPCELATTSIVLRPMLPVEPRRAILRGRLVHNVGPDGKDPVPFLASFPPVDNNRRASLMRASAAGGCRAKLSASLGDANRALRETSGVPRI